MNYRYIADIIIEAKTALRVGSGENSLLQDLPVQKDWNGLPMILGSSIAGVLRSFYNENDAKKIFGYEEHKINKGEGSRLIVSNALLLDENGEVCEDFEVDLSKRTIFKYFKRLPMREHTAITQKGVALSGSKFDEEVVYKGSRFKFRVEFLCESKNEKNRDDFELLLSHFKRDDFRLGSGSTKGFGKIGVVDDAIKYGECEIISEEYKKLTSSLNDTSEIFKQTSVKSSTSSKYIKYNLTLKPDSFFMFGSGFGNENNLADQSQVYEYEIDYSTKKVSEKRLLIPASSVKGAISHRTAFHYNCKVGATIENGKGEVGEKNDAVYAIFGHKKEEVNKKEIGKKGSILMSDCYIDTYTQKVFDHNKIDRFTGGVIDAALFAEETVQTERFTFEMMLKKDALNDPKIKESFEDALKDICTGMLPLGGMTTKGHGVFEGRLERDNTCLIDKLGGECDAD